jgi:hypothetical protein
MAHEVGEPVGIFDIGLSSGDVLDVMGVTTQISKFPSRIL